MGYLVVTAVLVVTFGRLGDIFGRVRMYNAGFAVFSAASLALSLCPYTGSSGALWLIAWRVVQGIGGALLTANSAAILTDAFPAAQRGFAIGVSVIAGMAGAFIGLVAGGLLADVDWRAVFWINVPIGVFGTVWAYLKLRELGTKKAARHRLVGQRHLRRRPGVDPHRAHLRADPARWPHDGLGRPLGAVRADRRRRAAGRVRVRRAARHRSDVRPRPVPHPRVHDGQPRELSVVDRARRPAVHPDHLAAGHLAAAARLQLRAHTVVGRHLHAAAHRRVPHRGTGRRLALRPFRRAAVHDRRHDRRRVELRAADAAAGELRVPDLRAACS